MCTGQSICTVTQKRELKINDRVNTECLSAELKKRDTAGEKERHTSFDQDVLRVIYKHIPVLGSFLHGIILTVTEVHLPKQGGHLHP